VEEPPFVEQQIEVTYRDGDELDEVASPTSEEQVGNIPSTGIDGLVAKVLAPSSCTPLHQPRQHQKMKVAVGGVRVHLPGYCLDGEFRCETFDIVTGAAHAQSRHATQAKVSCFMTPQKRMEAVIRFDSFGRPTHGNLRFSDTEAHVVLESSILDFGSGRAPYACEEGVTAAFSAFGPATTDGADMGIMLRYTE